MVIWGRIIGTFLGFKMLGFFGGILGYWIGSWFDQGLKLHLNQIPRPRALAIQQAFFQATFSVMGHLAKADGRVSEHEIRVAEQTMTRLDLNETLRLEAIRYFNEGKEAEFDLDQALSLLWQECQSHPDLLRFFIEIQLEVALADGELLPEKKRIFLYICQKLRFSPQEFEQLWAQQWASQAFHQWFSSQFEANARAYQSQYRSRQGSAYDNQRWSGANQQQWRQSPPDPASKLEGAYGVLGVAASATPQEIKKAYRRLMNQHHPDKLASRGLPEGMIKMAKEKTQQITVAYDVVRQARGFR